MNKSKFYIRDPKDIIDKFKIDNLVSKGVLQPVERYVMDEKQMQRFNDLFAALKQIQNPVAHFQSELKEGERLDGVMAVALSENANYLKEVAKKALDKFLNPLTT